MLNRKNLLAASSLALALIMNVPSLTAYAAPLTDNSTLGPGYPLMKGLSGPDELANLMEASLKKDPHGNARLDEARCKLNGSCATPRMYLQAIVAWHPKSGFHLTDEDLQKLPSYIRSLKNWVIKDTKFLSARLVHPSGADWQLDLNSGFKRVLAPGEMAWADTQTGETILLENCGNVAKEIPGETTEIAVTATCIKIHVRRPAGATGYRYVNFGPQEASVGGCPWTISEAGQPAVPLPDTDNCPLGERIRCDIEKIVQEQLAAHPGYGFGSSWERKGSILLSNPTDHEVEDVIQMPNSIKNLTGFVICYSRTDADGTPHEYTGGAYMLWRPTDRGHEWTLSNFNASAQ